MAWTVRQLRVNVTNTATWTQLQEAGVDYAVPGGGRAEVAMVQALALGTDPVSVELGISTDSTIDDVEKIWPPTAMIQNETVEDTKKHALRTTQAMWAKATGTSPNVVFEATILEVT